MPPNAYYQPGSLDEALGLLAEHGPSLLVMAGGTLVMPLVNEGVSFPEAVLSLRRAGLDYIRQEDDYAALGAAATMSQVIAWDGIPMLSQAARQIGGWAIRNMATVGGNLFAPPPAGDFAVALLALDADLKIAGPGGERILSLGDFYTGFMTTSLSPGELVTEIQLPRPQGRTAYIKAGRRHANTPAVVTVALHILEAGGVVAEARVALNGVHRHPFRAVKAEAALVGRPIGEDAAQEAADAAMAECEPFTDAVATDWYRRRMVGVYTRRAILSLEL